MHPDAEYQVCSSSKKEKEKMESHKEKDKVSLHMSMTSKRKKQAHYSLLPVGLKQEKKTGLGGWRRLH